MASVLLGKLNVQDPYGNKKVLKVYEAESGDVDYRLMNASGTPFAISNMQCGWRGRTLPDNVFEHIDVVNLFTEIEKAIKGSTYTATDTYVFSRKYVYKK